MCAGMNFTRRWGCYRGGHAIHAVLGARAGPRDHVLDVVEVAREVAHEEAADGGLVHVAGEDELGQVLDHVLRAVLHGEEHVLQERDVMRVDPRGLDEGARLAGEEGVVLALPLLAQDVDREEDQDTDRVVHGKRDEVVHLVVEHRERVEPRADLGVERLVARLRAHVAGGEAGRRQVACRGGEDVEDHVPQLDPLPEKAKSKQAGGQTQREERALACAKSSVKPPRSRNSPTCPRLSGSERYRLNSSCRTCASSMVGLARNSLHMRVSRSTGPSKTGGGSTTSRSYSMPRMTLRLVCASPGLKLACGVLGAFVVLLGGDS